MGKTHTGEEAHRPKGTHTKEDKHTVIAKGMFGDLPVFDKRTAVLSKATVNNVCVRL